MLKDAERACVIKGKEFKRNVYYKEGGNEVGASLSEFTFYFI